VEKRSEPNSLPNHFPRIFRFESFVLLVIAAQFKRAIHQSVHVNFFVDHLPDSNRLALLNEIPPPKFVRRESHGFRDAIEMPLERENALRRPESSERTVRRSVCSDHSTADSHVRAPVRPSSVNRPARKYHRRQSLIRAAVQRKVNVDCHQFSVTRYGRPVLRPGWVPLRRRHHVFGSVVNNLHRLPRFPRKKRRMPSNHRRIFFLTAKSSARFRLHHPNAILRQPKQHNQGLVNVVGALQRPPYRDAFFRVRLRDHSLRLDVELLLRAGFISPFDDQIGFTQRVFHMPFVDLIGFENVVRSPNHMLARKRVVHRKNRGQRLDFNAHTAPSLLEQIFVRMRKQHHRLFRVVHELISQARLIVNEQRDAILAGNILCGNDRKFFPRNARLEVNAKNASARPWAANRHAKDHARKFQVVHILRAARHFLPAFLTRHGLSDYPGCHQASLNRRSYPVSTPTNETLRAPLPASSVSTESSYGHEAVGFLRKSANHQIRPWTRPPRYWRSRPSPAGPNKSRPDTWDKARRWCKFRSLSIRSSPDVCRPRESPPLPHAPSDHSST